MISILEILFNGWFMALILLVINKRETFLETLPEDIFFREGFQT